MNEIYKCSKVFYNENNADTIMVHHMNLSRPLVEYLSQLRDTTRSLKLMREFLMSCSRRAAPVS